MLLSLYCYTNIIFNMQDGGSKVEEFCEGHDEGLFFFFRKKQSTGVSVPGYRVALEQQTTDFDGTSST